MRNGLRSWISSKESVEQKGDGVVVTNVTNEIELKSNGCEGLGPDGSLDAILVPEVGVVEETIASKAVGVGKKEDFSVPVGRVNANRLKVDDVGANNCDGKQVDGVDARNSNPEQADGVSPGTCNGEQVNGVDARNFNLEQADFVSANNCNGEKEDRVDACNSNLEQAGGVSADNGEQVDGVDDRNSNLEKADGVTVYSCNEEQVVGVDARNSNLEKVDVVSADTWNGEPVVGVDARNSNLEQADGVTVDNCNGEQVDGVDAHNSNLKLADGPSADNCNGGQGNDDNANNCNGEQADNVQTKGRRGRKRKNTEMSSNARRREMFDLNEMPVVQLSGRVLRSRTVAVRANDLIKGELNDVVDDKDEGVKEVDNKEIKLENSEKKGLEPIRGWKKKALLGRPRKVNKENGDAAVIIGNKHKDLGSKVSLKSDTSTSKLKGQSVASEKKDLRKKILDIVVRCGWEMQLVPRASRDYNDPVYVDPEGRTHWSITKAYKILKERIDSGVANDVERAGFTEIPDETLSKLFRIATKKRSDCGMKRSEGVEEKEPGMIRSSSKKTDDSSFEDKSNIVQKSCGRKRKSVSLDGRKKRRFALLARGSGNKSDPDDEESELYNKERNLLSWMIDLGTVTEGENVHYRDPVKGAALLEGKVISNGLSCNCCDEMHTILGFQLHAGSKSGKPLKNLYLLSGLSLFQCMENSWTQQLELSKIGFCSVNVAGNDHNDDTCNICGDGGKLMCCDCCPSTFHLSCLDIENVPDGDWHCMYCSCKCCGLVNDEELSQDDGNHILTCQLCEEKFHATCHDQTDTESMHSSTTSFCGDGCLKIFNHLKKFAGLKTEMEGGLSWSILHRCDFVDDTSLSDYPLKLECNAKLAIAHSVMDECFFPVVDPRSQSEMINNVTYNCGSNIKRLNYSGFYTFILEKGDEVVSSASVRFHGTQLAEMPFIATRNFYRQQGMSRQLLNVIEKVLSLMDIQKMIIPAVSDVMTMWTNSFSFTPLEEATQRAMKGMSIIVFPGTDMLQKQLPMETGSESEPSAPEVKPVAEASPENKTIDTLVDGETVDISEQNGEERCKAPLC